VTAEIYLGEEEKKNIDAWGGLGGIGGEVQDFNEGPLPCVTKKKKTGLSGQSGKKHLEFWGEPIRNNDPKPPLTGNEVGSEAMERVRSQKCRQRGFTLREPTSGP